MGKTRIMPTYATQDGRETTVATRHLAPCSEPTDRLPPSVPIQPGPSLEGEPDPHSVSTPDSSEMEGIPAPPSTPFDQDVPLWRSEHTRKPGGPACPSETFLKKGVNVVIKD